jgi:hypothetical protein
MDTFTLQLTGPHPYHPGRLPDVNFPLKIHPPSAYRTLKTAAAKPDNNITHTAGPFDLNSHDDQRFLLGVIFDLHARNKTQSHDWILTADPDPRSQLQQNSKPVALFTRTP